MTVIGVSDEPEAKVKPYLEANKVEYLIGTGVNTGYTPRGIPHAWLVDANGQVVWKGHPSGMTSAIIEEHLANVRLVPTFDDLPRELQKAARLLDAGKFGQGLKELEKAPQDDPAIAEAAKAAIEKAESYGKGQSSRADALAAEGLYKEAMELLDTLEEGFKGHAIGDDAKAKLGAWKKDRTVKTELEGHALLDKGEALEKAGQKPHAAKLYRSIVDGRKFEGTKCREKAEARLKALEAG